MRRYYVPRGRPFLLVEQVSEPAGRGRANRGSVAGDLFDITAALVRSEPDERRRAMAVVNDFLPKAKAYQPSHSIEPLAKLLRQVTEISDPGLRNHVFTMVCDSWPEDRKVSESRFYAEMRCFVDAVRKLPSDEIDDELESLARLMAASKSSASGNRILVSDIMLAYVHVREGKSDPVAVDEAKSNFLATLAESAMELDRASRHDLAGVLLDLLPDITDQMVREDNSASQECAYLSLSRLIDSVEPPRRTLPSRPLGETFLDILGEKCGAMAWSEIAPHVSALRSLSGARDSLRRGRIEGSSDSEAVC
ncbi:hypothetical protein FJU08_21000 [Martelella alba]|uniref:Uncharacterized protein n=1 Tax=Martelella alba TaxID=2590451 RepID=A0A506U0J8_9HYPH|nr:hypothetical protein FJU08_21000 [Martelella alba]